MRCGSCLIRPTPRFPTRCKSRRRSGRRRPISPTSAMTWSTARPIRPFRRECGLPTTGCGSLRNWKTDAGGLNVRIFESLDEIPRNFGRAVVTVGNYDGIHLAHQAILRSIVQRARELGASSLLVTFDPHPARILKPHGGPPLITPMGRKLELLAELVLDAG